jgi:hypothetical protein
MICRTAGDVLAQSGKRAAVQGVYHRVDARRKRTGAADESRAAAVRLSDGTVLLLEPSWSPAGARSDDEIGRFNGKEVVVTGIVHAEAPPPPEPAAAVAGPCITPVESITEARSGS